MPRLSVLHARVLAALVFFGALSLTAYWVLAGRGLYPTFLALELGEGPETHPLAAAGLAFIVLMVPGLVLILALAMMSPLREQFHPRQIAIARAEFRAAMNGAPQHRESQRGARNFGIAASGGVIGAGIRLGWFEAWFGDPGSLTASVVVALLFGLVAGLVHGRSALGRLGFCVSLAGVSLGSLPAVTWYLERRPEPLTIELLLPIFLGGLPGAIAFWGFSWWMERTTYRHR